MDDPKALKAKATRARRLANSMSDPTTVQALRAFADECEQMARDVENLPDAAALSERKETRMSDDKSKSGGRTRISLSEDYEVRDWSQKFGVTEDRLRAAVAKVGNQADDVERELRGS